MIERRTFMAVSYTHLDVYKRQFLTPDRLHTTFTFDSVFCEWDATSQRHMIDHNLRLHDDIGAGTTWVMGNHDQTRPVTRYGKRITGWPFPESGVTPESQKVWAEYLFPWPTDVETGRRRARAIVLLYLALPGGMYTVSYTHLDVYKRQTGDRAAGILGAHRAHLGLSLIHI